LTVSENFTLNAVLGKTKFRARKHREGRGKLNSR
jgi:hypothetical protein